MSDKVSNEIGKGLQWLRKSLAYTQYELAALAQLDYRHYQNIETGRVEVRVETLKRICDAFGFELSAFFHLVDRKPWLNEKPGKMSGNGELYVFRIEHQNSNFRMFKEVREILLEWGRDLVDGNKSSLASSSFPCVELDRRGQCVWKNHASNMMSGLEIGQAITSMFAADSGFENFAKNLDKFFEQSQKSFYQEVVFTSDASHGLKFFALIGLTPLTRTDSKTIVLACADISHHFALSESGDSNAQLSDLLLKFFQLKLGSLSQMSYEKAKD